MTWVGLDLGICPFLSIFISFLLLLTPCVFSAGRPEEQDDSENSTIYITGLTENATLEEMADFFKHSGIIRVLQCIFFFFFPLLLRYDEMT